MEKDMQKKDNMKTHRKKMPRDWSDAPTSQGMLRIVDKHQKLEGQVKGVSPIVFKREHGPADNLSLGILASRIMRQ